MRGRGLGRGNYDGEFEALFRATRQPIDNGQYQQEWKLVQEERTEERMEERQCEREL